MSATEPLSKLLGLPVANLTQEEKIFLEADLFLRVYEEICQLFTNQQRPYIKLLKSENNLEDSMLDADFARLIVKDILLSEEYTLDGLACYADTHKDVIYDVVMGYNSAPSAVFVKRMIALHRTVRPDVYHSISQKMMGDTNKRDDSHDTKQ